MKMFALVIAAALLSACAPQEADVAVNENVNAPAAAVSANSPLQAAVNAEWRSPEQRARDQYRHPEAALAFWGLRPGMTIIEIAPGGGAWWTPILANYAHTTGGRYIAGYNDLGAPNANENARNSRAGFMQEFSDASRYGQIEAINFGMASGLQAPDASADFILVARAFHNWARQDGATDRYMAEFARVLKPGGVLAVEQHRAPPGSDPTAGTGYVPESYVIEAAQRAGLTLGARSEINANPADDRDHPFGVWTLPPIRRSSASGQPDPNFDHAPYDAIGESDRMTLRFVKPS